MSDLLLEQVALVQEEDDRGVVEPLVPDYDPLLQVAFKRPLAAADHR